ncbi:hypothetical protein FGG08_007045 [Glutinoglossum americanum]|uniref:Uncharacterized protein n=1 Tax=Glutinoglossum americanum TaxID=1670608 RepID=A0A9P8I441_9PEZI|nr:hypothetical protein FGG08_007045 [Glutinoglossum americanum]
MFGWKNRLYKIHSHPASFTQHSALLSLILLPSSTIVTPGHSFPEPENPSKQAAHVYRVHKLESELITTMPKDPASRDSILDKIQRGVEFVDDVIFSAKAGLQVADILYPKEDPKSQVPLRTQQTLVT